MKTKTTNNPQTEIYHIIQTDTGYEVEHTGGVDNISTRTLIGFIEDEGLNTGYYFNAPDDLVQIDPATYLDDNYREVIEKYLNR